MRSDKEVAQGSLSLLLSGKFGFCPVHVACGGFHPVALAVLFSLTGWLPLILSAARPPVPRSSSAYLLPALIAPQLSVSESCILIYL